RQIARIVKELAIQRRIAAHPQPVDNRIKDKGKEDGHVGQRKGDGPDTVRAIESAAPSAPPDCNGRQPLSSRKRLQGYTHGPSRCCQNVTVEKIASARLNALSIACSGVMPFLMTSA